MRPLLTPLLLAAALAVAVPTAGSAAEDEAVNAVVLRAAEGRAFSTGMDVFAKEFRQAYDELSSRR